ncbi:MAG: hypothetical protein J0M08_10960 [Bacteroidetes bacterium]|nr:hypothetical protein [Bacteroidota bacterium]
MKFYFVKIIPLCFLLAVFSALGLHAQQPVTTPTDSTSQPISSTAPTTVDTAAKPAPPKLRGSMLRGLKPIPDTIKKIFARFDTLSMSIREGEIISKTMRVDNRTSKTLDFSVDISYPAGWKTLNNRKKLYTVLPGDSLFVPVRIIPHGKIRGNTKYLINAYILEKDSTPVATGYFYTSRERVSSWDISVLPTEKIYFKNKDNSSHFKLSVMNTGNEDQELLLDMENIRQEIMITDTTDRVIKKSIHDFKLKPNQDTIFAYNVKYTSGLRNYKIIDSENYRPNSSSEQKVYTIFAKTSEPKIRGGRALTKAKKIDFVKLGDNLKANQYGYSVFPIIMDANLTNILGGQPILNLNFRGNSVLENGAYLTYFSQFFFSNYYYTNQYLTSSFHYVGYFKENYFFELGDVGGVGGGAYSVPGRGMTAGYRFLPQHKIAGFYTRSPRFFAPTNRDGFGLVYSFLPTFGNYNVGYSRANNSATKLVSNYFSLNGSYKIASRHSVNAGGVFVNHKSSQTGNIFTRSGFQLFGGYTGSYFGDRRMRSSISGSYISKFFDPYNGGDMLIVNHTSSYAHKKVWNFQLTNNYNNRKYISLLNTSNPYQQVRQENMINATRRFDSRFVGLGAFYNFSRFDAFRFHTRGINLNVGNYDYETNTLVSSNAMAGYTRSIDEKPTPKDYFFFQFFTLMRYRVLSANFRYTYGNLTPYQNALLNGSMYPQTIAASVNYQYQFKNPHLVLQNYINYTFFNTFKRHSFGYTPDLFYFTDNGWRFRVTAGFFISSSNASSERQSLNSTISEGYKESKNLITKSVLLNFGVRKEFGVPIPFSKRKFYSTDFVAFIDLNGNGKKEVGEYNLENIVLKLDKWEVLTNEKGKATIKNVPTGNYKLSAFSLEELEGYFPNIEEELDVIIDRVGDKHVPIPFVKGIKIYGKVVLDREKVSENTDVTPIDLTGIKISAMNGKVIHTLTGKDGEFNFYVPFGKYTLNMDENVLSDRWKILQNNIELELDKNTESLFITFYIVEKRRKINKKTFGADGKQIGDSLLTAKNAADNGKGGKGAKGTKGGKGAKNGKAGADKNAAANATKGGKQNVDYDVIKDAFLKDLQDATKLKGLVYTIQIGAFQKPLSPATFKDLKGLMYERIDNNFVRISGGQFISESSATIERDNLIRVGFVDAFVSAYYNGKVISLQEASQIKKTLVK